MISLIFIQFNKGCFFNYEKIKRDIKRPKDNLCLKQLEFGISRSLKMGKRKIRNTLYINYDKKEGI